MTKRTVYSFLRFALLTAITAGLGLLCVWYVRGTITDAQTNPVIISSLCLLFIFPLIVSWDMGGSVGGVLVCLIASFLTFIIALGTAQSRLLFYILLFGFSSSIGYVFFSRLSFLRNEMMIQVGKFEERRNLLANDLKTLNEKVVAYEHKSDVLDLLKTITESLSSTLDLGEVTKRIVESTYSTMVNSQRCLLYLVDSKKEELYLAASRKAEGVPTITAKKGDIFDLWVFKYRQPLIVEDIKSDYRFPHDENESERSFRSLIAAPLITEHKITGILRVDSQYNHNYHTDDLRLLSIISNLAALASYNASLYATTEELAIRDDLTGVFLQRHFKKRLGEEMQKALRRETALSLLMIDVDDFKRYNDEFGHVAGDIILKRLAAIITQCVGKNGIVGRYGGEEFAVILPQTQKKTAAETAETIRSRIASQEFSLRRKKTSITVSIGVSSFPEDTKFEIELFEIADKRLYRVKEKGKNNVCSDLSS